MTKLQTALVGLFAVLLVAAVPGIWIQVGFERASADESGQVRVERAEPALEPGNLEPTPAPDPSELPEVTFELSPVESGQLQQERGTEEWIRLMKEEDRERFGITYVDYGTSGRLNLNDATSEQLQQLEGVGPATAEDILETREEWGGIHSFYELNQISGIGGSMIEQFVDEIHFDGRVPQRVDDS